eukprot:CAMPEP_0119146742 /NCGR_PEP_ID=MMETSP1310-20130426/39347_1 /TAXON_ID=464262 /ORGANISM="Genus nov. species nov., Strain RCC2339" /LENGTH=754 /DNA_ID=CAMNT_0007138655 /DNA_START=126 /DNA_END=2386 /DNA_ORIENTATION=-
MRRENVEKGKGERRHNAVFDDGWEEDSGLSPSSFVDVYTEMEHEDDDVDLVYAGGNPMIYSQQTDQSPLRSFAARVGFELSLAARKFWRQTPQMWTLILLLGIASAAHSILFEYLQKKLTEFRDETLFFDTNNLDGGHSVRDAYWYADFSIWIMWCIPFCLVALAVVMFVSSYSAGSGIPEMKSILSGIVAPPYLSFTTLLAKDIGLLSALVGGLSVGKEGPYVHICSIFCNLLLKIPVLFPRLCNNNQVRMQLLSAACAAGVASSFGTPIGGVLFSMECTATYYLVENFWQATALTCWTLLLINVWGSLDLLDMFQRISSHYVESNSYGYWQLFCFAVVGLIGSVLGAVFVRVLELTMQMNPEGDFWGSAKGRFLKVALIGILIAFLSYPYPELRNTDSAFLYLFQDASLNASGLLPLVSIYIIKFIITILSVAWTGVPCGVFTPLFVMGAIYGRFCGEVFKIWFPYLDVHPSLAAIVGAAALSGGATRTVSTAVIVVELTGQIHLLLPTLVSVLVACGIGRFLSPSVYDVILHLKGLPYVPSFSKNLNKNLLASDIMRTSWATLSTQAKFKDVVRILEESPTQWAFPVVEQMGDQVFLGAVSRGTLEDVLREGVASISPPEEQSGEEDRSGVVRTAGEEDQPRRQSAEYSSKEEFFEGRVPFVFSSIASSKLESDAYTVVVDPSAFQIAAETSLVKVHYVFSMLGLSHTFVTSKARLVGIITKEDLIDLNRQRATVVPTGGGGGPVRQANGG